MPYQLPALANNQSCPASPSAYTSWTGILAGNQQSIVTFSLNTC